jgi:hypothetical protein
MEASLYRPLYASLSAAGQALGPAEGSRQVLEDEDAATRYLPENIAGCVTGKGIASGPALGP